jgi:hypothetical protein
MLWTWALLLMFWGVRADPAHLEPEFPPSASSGACNALLP